MRCFVAIELPARVREQLAELQARLREMDRLVRWVRPEQIHLTLKFLGEVPDPQVPKVCSAVAKTAAQLTAIPFDIGGVGCFPGNGPARIVWTGIVGPPTELVASHTACERVLANLGYPPEDRDFRPHLTIGRSREPRGAREIRNLLNGIGDFKCDPFTARELTILQSVLDRAGPTYTVLTRAAFKAS
jgi:2'-5' RNA ligase